MTQISIFQQVIHFYSFWAETFPIKNEKKKQYLCILIYLAFIALCEFPFLAWDAWVYISIFLSKEHIHMNLEYT